MSGKTNDNEKRAGNSYADSTGSVKITTKKVCRNPEAWAAFVWTNGNPHCVGDEFHSRKAAFANAKYYAQNVTGELP